MDRDKHSATIPRTKNGRLVACEPCQRRKYACDRSFPICQRCKRSRAKDPCRYLSQSSQHHQTSAIHSDNSAIAFVALPQNDSTLTKYIQETSNIQATDRSTQTGLSSNIYKINACLNSTQNISLPHILSLQYYRRASLGLSTEDLQTALDVLSSLPSPDAERILAKPHINPFDGWIPLSTTVLLAGLRTTFASAFCQESNGKHLEALALTIFSNTAQKFPDSQWYPSEDWYTTISGPNLRWEVIGVLFSSWALSALQNKEDIDGYRPRVLALKFFDVMECCIKFCRDKNANNVLLLYLLYRTSIVSSILHGPSNTGFWRFHSQAVSLACCMGLNIMPDASIQDPRISEQSGRRLFTAIYVLDKAAAMFSGKLPLLPSDSCSTALPLDICNTILINWKPSQVVDYDSLGVNEKGWNKNGKIYSTTSLRARGLIAQIRENIVTFALNKKQKSALNLISLRSQQVNIFDSLPSDIRLTDGDTKVKSLEPHVLYTKLFIHLEHLQNLFLIEKLLQNAQPTLPRDSLIQTSLDIVSATVTFWTRNDILVGMQGDHEWFIVGYAVPAAVVLCEALLQIESHGGSTSSISNIIQQLSLLGAFLEWLLAKVPCTDHCYRAKNLISKVLDQVLNPLSEMSSSFNVDKVVDVVYPSDLRYIDTLSWLT